MTAMRRPYRVRLYTYADAGSGGVLTETYTFREEVWAGVERITGTERTGGETETHDLRIRLRLHERVTVNPSDLVQVNGVNFLVTGPTGPLDFDPVNGFERVVDAQWTDKEALTTAES